MLEQKANSRKKWIRPINYSAWAYMRSIEVDRRFSPVVQRPVDRAGQLNHNRSHNWMVIYHLIRITNYSSLFVIASIIHHRRIHYSCEAYSKTSSVWWTARSMTATTSRFSCHLCRLKPDVDILLIRIAHLAVRWKGRNQTDILTGSTDAAWSARLSAPRWPSDDHQTDLNIKNSFQSFRLKKMINFAI